MTLLELVLSLALSALLLMAISMALHIHWRAFDVRRSRVEEAQLASAILRSISDDIRGTLKFEPPNLKGLNLTSLASSALASAAGGEMGDGTGETEVPPDDNPPQQPEDNIDDPQNPPTNGEGDATETPTAGGGTGSTATTSGDSTEMAAESGPSVVVGLYGSATQLQFDISRLPRVDQYQMQETDEGTQIPSDIKTVVYFLRSEEVTSGTGAFAMTDSSSQPSTSGTGSGLMRAESDRAVSAYGEVNGSSDSIYGGAKLLAAEVTSLQFQYFDGTEWLTEWNSDDLGGLPTAIEVLLTIGPPPSGTSATASATAAPSLDAPEQPVYRMLVHLPTGGISPSTEESTEMTDAAGEMTDPASTNNPSEETMP